MTDVLALANRLRTLGPEDRLAYETIADVLEHLAKEIELLRHTRKAAGPEAAGREVTVVTAPHNHAALYVDGRLVAQGSKLIGDPMALRRLIAELGGTSIWRKTGEKIGKKQDRFPDRLSDLELS